MDARADHHNAIDDVATRVRATIRARLAGNRPVTLRALAATLMLSARTLQRRLQAHGCSLTSLLLEERTALMREATAQANDRDEVAAALGYRSTRSVDRLSHRSRIHVREAAASFGRVHAAASTRHTSR